MATYRKRSNGWRAEIRKHGHYLSATYSTKAKAVEWATLKEAEIMEGRIAPEAKNKKRTVGEVFWRYAEEVSVTKRGWRWENIRLKSLCKEPLAKVKLIELTRQDLANFRDRRLKSVSASTVNRELNLISAVFTKARKEWEWVKENPVFELDRPKMPRPRDRLISQSEIDRMILVLGYSPDRPIQTKTQLIGLFFLLAIETGMRLGEMCSLKHSSVHLPQQYIQLSMTKNGDRRQVPLSSKACTLCEQFLETRIWTTSLVASTLFRKAVKRAGIENLHFHDTRHEAITRMSRKLDVLALARVVGHRDLKSLMIYYNESATSLAAKLG